jgi:threonine dehydratase
VSPHTHPAVLAGQGTIAVDVLRQLYRAGPSGPEAVFVAVGGGGLIGGIGSHLKTVSPTPRIVGCWPGNSPVLHECLLAGKIIDVPEQPTLSVSTTGGMEAEAITLSIAQNVIDRSVLVTEAEILAASRRIYREDDQIIEGAAAVAVAAFLKSAGDYAGQTVVIVICGGNAGPALEARIKAP